MRIGIDIRELEKGKKTGMGRFVFNFLNFVSKNDKQNQYLLLGNQNTRSLNFGGCIKLKIIPEFCKIFWDQIVLVSQLSKENLDIFFSPSYAAPIFSKAKIIVTCHDTYFLGLNKNPIINCIRRYYCRQIWNRAGIIITVSKYSRQQVINFLGFNPQKVRVVYDSITDIFKPMDKSEAFDNLINKFPTLKEDFILYVGNLTAHKNLTGLIKAYSLLPESLKQRFQLVIVGEKDKNYSSLLQLVKQVNVIDNVHFLGLVSEEDLLFLYNTASILALVSFWEGFGLPALEAMACATPVVVSNTASLPEVVGDAGLYINPQDIEDIKRNLEKILTDEALRKDLSAKALNQSEKFKVEYSAHKILEIFKELFNSKDEPRFRRG